MINENVSDIPSLIQSACLERSFFESGLLNIDSVVCGKVQVSMPLDVSEALDHRQMIRGSVIYKLIETVLHIGAASVGAVAETLNFCCTVVRYTAAQNLRAVCRICHHGRMTLVAEVEVYDEQGTLLATALTTLFVVDAIKDIPRKW